MAKKRPSPTSVYQLKVTLAGSKPPIWRRLLVPADIRLSDLHDVLQIAMGWDESHLHQFKTRAGDYYSRPEFELEDVGDECKARLNELVPAAKGKLTYEYDFGDSWEHEIVVEKILEPVEGVRYPVCTDGKRACPPEDCGGVWGYADLLDVIADPKHPDHADQIEWLGEDFDPEAFDADAVNGGLRKLSR